MVLHTWI